jgi:hypothetical protein
MRALLALSLLAPLAGAQDAPTTGFAGTAADKAPRVDIAWNRLYDYEEVYALFDRLAAAYPDKLSVYERKGLSSQSRELRVYVLNNPATGPDTVKPAMWIDANVHGNEVQGAEVVLYTAWYLLENYDSNPRVRELVDRAAFYLLPSVNPDGRAAWFNSAGTSSTSRSGQMPLDNDRDGVADEDGYDDLDGDGHITSMRKYVPGAGTHRLDPDDPRVMQLVPRDAPVRGDWILLGREGIDNDGDGQLNEDGPGGYDMNRAWPSSWQPGHVQYGAGPYPLYWPETRFIARFIYEHPNIAAVQSFHNAGGMILRGPGAEWQGDYPGADNAVYDALGREGERMLPFYRYLVIWSGLYTVHGGFTDWTNDGLGIISFANELWNGGQYFQSPGLSEQQDDPDSPIAGQRGNYWFDDRLEFGDQFVDWTPFDHPQYGKVELGGWKKTRGRVPPRFMQEELAHRNMAFTLFQAEELPLVRFGETRVEQVGGDVWRVWVDIANDRIAPTITARAAQNNVVPPDVLTLDGNVNVITAGWVSNRFRPGATDMIEQHDLKRILLRDGAPGRTTRTIEYLVRGSGGFTLQYASAKGGTVETRVVLR